MPHAFPGTASPLATLAFIRKPLSLITTMTSRHGPTWWIRLGGKKLYVTWDRRLALEATHEHRTEFYEPSPFNDVLGENNLLALTGEQHRIVKGHVTRLMGFQPVLILTNRAIRAVMPSDVEPGRDADGCLIVSSILLHFIATLVVGEVNVLDNHESVEGLKKWMARFFDELSATKLMAPSTRISLCGLTRWDRFIVARDELRSRIRSLIYLPDSLPYQLLHIAPDLSSEMVIDQIITLIFGCYDNPLMTTMNLLIHNAGIETFSDTLDRVAVSHPVVPIIPRSVVRDCVLVDDARRELQLREGDGIGIIAMAGQRRDAFGYGHRMCPGRSWTYKICATLASMLAWRIRVSGPAVIGRSRLSYGPISVPVTYI